MKIEFSQGLFGGKKTVDVARQCDLKKANARIDEICESIENVNIRLKAFERRLSSVEKSLDVVSERLRDDCRTIFADVIREVLSPAFEVMDQVAKAQASVDDAKTNGDECAEKKIAKKRKVSDKKTVITRNGRVFGTKVTRGKKGNDGNTLCNMFSSLDQR